MTKVSPAVADACTDRDVCIFFVGSSMIAVHEQQGPGNAYAMWSGTTESEGFDRSHIRLPGSQEEIIKVTFYLKCDGIAGSLLRAWRRMFTTSWGSV